MIRLIDIAMKFFWRVRRQDAGCSALHDKLMRLSVIVFNKKIKISELENIEKISSIGVLLMD